MMHDTFGNAAPLACAVLGGAAGAVVGGVASNWHHGDDDRDDLRRGAGIGAGAGAVGGALLCALGYEENKTPPTVRATCSPSSGAPPLTVDCRCVAESDHAEIKSYAWDFGDGGKAGTQNASHTYTSAGNYTAKCTVMDAYDVSGVGVASVAVAEAATKSKIVLRGINFDFDKAVIKPEFEGVLDAGIDVLKENPSTQIQVAGYTDSVGTDAYNQGLSERRANAVRDYFVTHGIDASRLTSVGFGEGNPVADNSTADGRAQNRRVELNVQ